MRLPRYLRKFRGLWLLNDLHWVRGEPDEREDFDNDGCGVLTARMPGNVGEHGCAGRPTRLHGEDEKAIRKSEFASAGALLARRLARGGCRHLGDSVRILDYALALDGGTQILVL